MFVYEEKTPEAIREEMLANLQSDLDKREGSFASDMAAPFALEMHKFYASLNAVQPIVWVNETSGNYLDQAADEIGMEPRKQGTPAQVGLRIAGEPGYTVPAGTMALTDEGLLFSTSTFVEIPESGVADVPALAQEIGSRYNVPSDAIRRFYHSDTRLRAVTNPEPAMGGTDPETDESLYSRLVKARQRPATSGNIYHYEMWALETPGVGAAKVFPLWNGPGTVKVLIADEQRQPVDAGVVAACAKHIEEMRPIGANVTVVSARMLQIRIDVALILRQDVTTHELVLQKVREAVMAYFAKISLFEQTVRHNKIGAIIMTLEEVNDYEMLLLNGRADNISMSAEETPLLGEVNITWI